MAVTRNRYVTINGVPLATYGWECEDDSPLLDAAAVRGDDVTVSAVGGVTARPRVRDSLRAVLAVVVYGDRDQDGLAYANPYTGLRTNLAHLKSNLLAPYAGGAATVPISHKFEDGSSVSGQCMVLPPVRPVPVSPITVRITLDVLIPSGQLT